MRPTINRRRRKRLKIDRSIHVPVHVFPVLPFLGPSVDAQLLNISSGGMALHINLTENRNKIPRGTKIKIHFRLPSQPLCECAGVVTHSLRREGNHTFIGIRFTKTPSFFGESIEQMCADNDRCDRRIGEMRDPLCEASCSFHSLCNKPLRDSMHSSLSNSFEIAFQRLD